MPKTEQEFKDLYGKQKTTITILNDEDEIDSVHYTWRADFAQTILDALPSKRMIEEVHKGFKVNITILPAEVEENG